jgi:predicted dehydrogenase/threonine dehydrogenase-like Zn-dependent dehydrogenase
MKQLFKTGRKNFIVKDIPAPLVSKGEILIEVKNSLISSGTETMGVKNNGASGGGKISKSISNLSKAANYISDKGYQDFLRKLNSRDNIASASGYSVAGVVVDKGKDITDFEIGDRVAAAGSGIAGHAEIVCVPKNLVCKLPDNVSFVHASFTTVGSIALQGVRQADVQIGENVVVIGLGLIGILTVQLLKASGCRVFGVDLNRERIDFAKSVGLDYGFVEGEDDVVGSIKNLTSQKGADTILVCAGTKSSQPANQALEIARRKGKVVIVGVVGMDLSRDHFYKKELDFKISCSYGPGRYDDNYEVKGIDYPFGYVRWTENRNMQAFLWMISKKMLDIESLISDVFNIEDSIKAFEKLISQPDKSLAMVINYPNENIENKLSTISSKDNATIKSEKDILNFAVIGAGGFASRTYLPFIYRSKNINLTAVANKTGKSAKKIADDFDAAYCTTDYRAILDDASVDCVIIASRHNLHFQMADDAVKSTKHLLLEKPMGMTLDEVDALEKSIHENKIIFAVGYNRRYSQLAMQAKELIDRENAPKIITYRVNAGSVPIDNWLQTKEIGGGRIIGEGCHFLDLMNFFISKAVTSISVDFIPVDNASIIAKDNYIATIKYEDGSIGNLIYTSIGSGEQEKEFIEIFTNNKSLVIKDFIELELYGFNKSGIKLKKQDKGQEKQLHEFINKVKGKESNLLSVDESVLAAKMAIEIDRMLDDER